MAEQGEQKSGDGGHKRRKRYGGTHPKKFGQKYKERNPGKYPEMQKHLRAKGKTPAGTHVAIMIEEIITLLKPTPGMVVADCTLGYGGHANAFMNCLGPEGKLVGFDVDGVELEKAKTRLAGKETPLVAYNKNFAGIASVMGELGIDGFDIIFADLGVSSMQIDDPSRGISYKNKGPLDMRMDLRLPQTGMGLLMKLSQKELSEGLWELSDEPDHDKIAAAIVRQRQVSPITQTSQLIRLVFDAKRLTIKQWKQQQMRKFNTLHPAARTFQALRIMVNDELGVLKELLRIAPDCLKPGGRIGFLSFHSGEDRLVKQSFKDGYKLGIYKGIAKSPIRPRVREIRSNPRSTSAKFRWAIRAD